MVLSKFGPFATVLTHRPGSLPSYQVLLRLSNERTREVIDQIQSVLSAGEAGAWIDALFDDPDWRPHLVASMGLILDDNQHLMPTGLWRAVDAGSWVTPQLVVTAYFIDPEFPLRLVERIRSLQRSAKLMTSLVFMGRRVPSLSTWLEEVCADARIAELLAQDVDDVADICDEWLEQLTLQFARRGRQLKPKCA